MIILRSQYRINNNLNFTNFLVTFPSYKFSPRVWCKMLFLWLSLTDLIQYSFRSQFLSFFQHSCLLLFLSVSSSPRFIHSCLQLSHFSSLTLFSFSFLYSFSYLSFSSQHYSFHPHRFYISFIISSFHSHYYSLSLLSLLPFCGGVEHWGHAQDNICFILHLHSVHSHHIFPSSLISLS